MSGQDNGGWRPGMPPPCSVPARALVAVRMNGEGNVWHRQLEDAPAVDPGTLLGAAELDDCLRHLGWIPATLARMTGRDYRQVQRWMADPGSVPADVTSWLRAAAAWHRAHPCPYRTGMRTRRRPGEAASPD